MKTRAARFIAPLTLFEWGAIFTYFYFSHRIAAFLRPGFRPFVLMTGILLLLIALCVLFFPGDAGCADPGGRRSSSKLTTRALLAFLVLLLPIALAAKISPDTFDRALIENRGAAETADAVRGASSRVENPPAVVVPQSKPVYIGVDESAPAPANPKLPSPQTAFQYSASVDVPESPDSSSTPRSFSGPALNERPGVITAFGPLDSVLDMSASPLNQGSFQSDKKAVVPAEVVDLLIAARKPALMKSFDGQTVEMVGQYLSGGKGSFRLLRMLMICCAADAQPLAVRVESRQTLPDMAWVKVVGKVTFSNRSGKVMPVVTAGKVTRIAEPEEPYIY